MFESILRSEAAGTRVAVLMLVATLLVAACSGNVSGPLAPSGLAVTYAKSGKHGGGSTGSSSTIVVTEVGAIAAGAASFDVWTDNGKKLSGGTGSADAVLNFTKTLAAIPLDHPLSVCSVSGGRNVTVPLASVQRAVSKLEAESLSGAALSLSVDKGALGAASTDHHLGGTWQDNDGLFDFGVGTSGKLGDPVTVSIASGDDINTGTSHLTYTGGSVIVKDRTSSASFSVVCPNLDEISVTVKR